MKLATWIGVSISGITILVGSIMWITTIYNQGTASANDIKEIKFKQDKYMDDITKMREDISAIRVKLEMN